MPDFVICVRDVFKEKQFVNEPGKTRFLRVPGRQTPKPSHEIERQAWVELLIEEAKTSTDPVTDLPVGDILVFVHGYNNGPEQVINTHRRLKQDLAEAGYEGAVVSFDWPSAQSAINYLEDREDAKLTALRLVKDGILLLSQAQSADCRINVHLLGHSMGAYVIREAFDDADDRPRIAASNWTVSQLCLIGADISSASMGEDNPKSSSLYRHAVRITNYFNPFDDVLKLSNVKRIGVAPRLGRVGLPDDAGPEAVNIDCGPYYDTHVSDNNALFDSSAHGWYIGDKLFTQDLLHTLRGDIDRHRIPTRQSRDGGLVLEKPTDDEGG